MRSLRWKRAFCSFVFILSLLLTQRVLAVKVQVIYFVNKSEAMVFTERLSFQVHLNQVLT